MAAVSKNVGFHVLEEFVGEAVHVPANPPVDRGKPGKNAGMFVLEEMMHTCGNKTSPDSDNPVPTGV